MNRAIAIVLIPVVFGALGFLYSLIGLTERPEVVFALEVFRSLTIQEIGGHVAFGFLAALPTRDLKLALICGLMAITIDTDHVLNALKIPIEGRMDHSILFAVTSPAAIGYLVMKSGIARSIKTIEPENRHVSRIFPSGRVFWEFFVLTATAFLAHIAYDTIVDDHALFPLLVPFSFKLILIPRLYGLAIEAAAALLTFLSFRRLIGITTTTRTL